jgi:hypothetical protein
VVTDPGKDAPAKWRFFFVGSQGQMVYRKGLRIIVQILVDRLPTDTVGWCEESSVGNQRRAVKYSGGSAASI